MKPKAFRINSVVPLDDENYPLVVQELIRRSTSRFWLAMFLVDPYVYDDRTGQVRSILRALRDVHRRCVDVRVLVDRGKGTPAINLANQLTYLLLRSAHVPCRYYTGARRSMHGKYLIWDTDTIVLGSHNFSSGAFNSHRESSLLIKSEDLAAMVATRFLEMWSSSEAANIPHTRQRQQLL